ncbi:MAG: glucose-1-phosphate cytidylyltransferase [Chloroflexi bacterium]|nr:glucose-1-phosphate cytidylyltransferase [Chloroflexota bacterium]
MQTVILAGGLGTRLREETEFRPKPMVEIGGRPILWHIMKMYAHYGFSEFVTCLGYRGDMIKEYFLNYEAMNNDFTATLGQGSSIEVHGAHDEQEFKVTLADTGRDTMTGGRVARIKQYIEGDTFLLTYGDGVSDIDIGALVEFHKSHGRLATVTAVRPTSRFGILDLEPNGNVIRFEEKPETNAWANAGYFVLDRRVFDYLDGDDCIFEREPLQRLASDGQLAAFRHAGSFYTMDTYREFQALNALWESGEASWKTW